MSPADHFLTFCARHFAPCRRDTLTAAELLSIVENHPALHDLTHPRADVDTAERQPSPRDDGQNIDWKARAEYLEASLSTLKSRIDVEGMARIVDPWAFNQCEWASRDDNVELLRKWLTVREIAIIKAQALRTLILGEEVEEQSRSSVSLPSVVASDARTAPHNSNGKGEPWTR